MGAFLVILQDSKEELPKAYFTPHNEIVGSDRSGVWTEYEDAQKAAVRAALQDPLKRKVTVKEL